MKPLRYVIHGLAALHFLASIGAHAQRVLNIDFSSGTVSPKTGLAATGQSPADFWNLYSRDDGQGGFRTWGSVTNLKWADQSQSTIGLVVTNAPGSWGSGAFDAMMSTYLYPFNAGEIGVAITNLPEASYQVYLYGHGIAATENGVFEVRVGQTAYGRKSTLVGNGWNQAAWVEGAQYVRFSEVLVSAGADLVICVQPGQYGHAVINGLQLVQGPATVDAIVFSPIAREFTNSVTVAMYNTLGVGVIRYTLDGTSPGAEAPAYTGPITLDKATSVAARVFFSSFPISDTLNARYERVYAIEDGVPNDWRQRYFGAGYRTDPRVAALADPDGDGATNLQEYVGKTDPLDPLSGYALRIKLVPAISWNSVPNQAYRVWRKESLGAPEWTVVIPSYVATNEIAVVADLDVPDTTSFYAVEPIPSNP